MQILLGGVQGVCFYLLHIQDILISAAVKFSQETLQILGSV